MRPLLVPFLLLGTLGCGGAPPEGATPPAAQATGGEEELSFEVPPAEAKTEKKKPSAIEVLGITPPEHPWSEMSEDDREFYMIGKVLPIMKETFQDFDSYAFDEFECQTCHGKDAEERQFAMPSPSLPPVPDRGTEAFAHLERDHPRMVRFMEQKVTPRTATLLGFEVADGEGGFGCNGCHPHP